MEHQRAILKDLSQTGTGLKLVMVAFALVWIPYVSSIGAFIGLIGTIFLFLGRHVFGPAHHRNVILGGVCVLAVFITALAAGIWFVGSLLATVSPGQALRSLAPTFQSDLGVLLVIGFVTTGLTVIA
jgi:hypothetical protein